jgi:hypothetical protein
MNLYVNLDASSPNAYYVVDGITRKTVQNVFKKALGALLKFGVKQIISNITGGVVGGNDFAISGPTGGILPTMLM